MYNGGINMALILVLFIAIVLIVAVVLVIAFLTGNKQEKKPEQPMIQPKAVEKKKK